MKNYASARAGKNKTAYRTPSVFRYQSARKAVIAKTSEKFFSRKKAKIL